MTINVNHGVLDRSPFAEEWARLHRVQQAIKDKYRGQSRFPIGTYRPIQSYPEGEDVPEEQIYFFEMDTTSPNDATSNCFIGQAGTHKTTLLKTITYYNSLIPGTKIGIMDLKGNSLDWAKCNFLHKNKGMLYPDDPATMNIIAGCPLFALRGLPDKDKNKIAKLNLQPKEFTDKQILTGLGFAPIAKEHLYRLLQMENPIDQLLPKIEELYKKRKIVKGTYDNLVLLLDNMIRAGFLAKKNYVDIDKIWDDKYNWAFGFNSKEVPFLSVYVDKLLSKIFDRANSAKGQKERYWIIVDDCQKAFGSTMSTERYPSVQTGIDSITLWRSVGINMNFGVQTPTLLNDEIYSDIKHFFIFRCSNVHVLTKHIPNKRIIDTIRTLNFRPEEFISECVHVFPDRHRAVRFYPFNSPLAT